MIPHRLLPLHFITAGALLATGCTTTPRQMWESLKGDGFTGWSDDMASGMCGYKDAKPSGFFTDRRSEQIEKNLGGF